MSGEQARHRMCPPCRDLYMRWLDATMAPSLRIHSIGEHSAYVVTEARRGRAEDHLALVRRQCAGVARDCREGRHATPRDPAD